MNVEIIVKVSFSVDEMGLFWMRMLSQMYISHVKKKHSVLRSTVDHVIGTFRQLIEKTDSEDEHNGQQFYNEYNVLNAAEIIQ